MQNSLYKLFEHKYVLEVCVHIRAVKKIKFRILVEFKIKIHILMQKAAFEF